MNRGCGTNGDCANFCENRLLSYRGAVNAALGTTLSFPPMFALVPRKPQGIVR